ncbi:MAG TPA: hypothetical protein VEH84_09525 [Alphaproteobacteria bacterium]|nr:hypothetical protein [Alphaproteobacteria bacterium]
MLPVMTALIGTAVASAERRAGPAETAIAVLAALRRLRALIDEQAGFAAAALWDDSLREILLAQSLQRRARGDEAAGALPVPSHSEGERRARAILEDAVQSTLMLNAVGPGNLAVQAATGILLGHLLRLLDGVPAAETLLAELRREPEMRAVADPAGRPQFGLH